MCNKGGIEIIRRDASVLLMLLGWLKREGWDQRGA